MVLATEAGPLPATTQWLHGLWVYYRGYTDSAVHTAAAAALAIFGLLIFIDPLFAVLAIVSYVCPPIILYTFDADIGTDREQSERTAVPARSENSDTDTDTDSDDGDSDSDRDDGDTDSDG
ncbi:hypothetical protein ACYJ1Y_16650 [Natrialbaceae archaeon A-gly3]